METKKLKSLNIMNNLTSLTSLTNRDAMRVSSLRLLVPIIGLISVCQVCRFFRYHGNARKADADHSVMTSARMVAAVKNFTAETRASFCCPIWDTSEVGQRWRFIFHWFLDGTSDHAPNSPNVASNDAAETRASFSCCKCSNSVVSSETAETRAS